MNIFSIIGSFFTLIICRPFGWVLGECYQLTKSYGLAILMFTVITRVFLLPLAIKQQKSTAEMVRMAPKLENIRKKYGKDQKRLQEETMNLYKEENYSPFGGCLPLVIQIPIIWALFTIIYQPLTYIVGLSQANIDKVVGLMKLTAQQKSRQELYAAEYINTYADKLTFLPHKMLHINFMFFNLDLSQTPVLKFNAFLLIPIICYITSLLSSWLSMKFNSAANTQQTKGMNFSMLLVMPLFSAWFTFQVPAGVGFYWICTNLFMIAQVLLLNKFYNPKKLAEAAEERAMLRRAAKTAEISEKSGDGTEPEDGNGSGSDSAESKISGKPPVETEKNPQKLSKRQLKEADRQRLAASREAEKKKIDQ